MLRFLKAILVDALGLFGWLGRTVFEGLTGRSLAAERAEREQAEADAAMREQEVEAERAHRANVEAMAADTLEATLRLVEARGMEGRSPVVDQRGVMSERRARQDRIAAEHAAASEVRSSRFVDEVGPDLRPVLRFA